MQYANDGEKLVEQVLEEVTRQHNLSIYKKNQSYSI